MSGSDNDFIRRMIDAALDKDAAENPPDFDAIRRAAAFREKRNRNTGKRFRSRGLMVAAAALICVTFGAAAIVSTARGRIRQEIQNDAEYFVERLFSESMLEELDAPVDDLFGSPSALEELSFSEG
jgi:hypothetical protein